MDTKLLLGTLALVGSIGLVTAIYTNQASDDSAAAGRSTTTDSRDEGVERARAQRQTGEIVYARRFAVREPFAHQWCAERPMVSEGWLVVVAASTEHLQPRQVREPVLFVGSQVADRVNTGRDSGKVVCIVPGPIDLTRAPVYFSEPKLPERLTAKDCARQLQAAQAAGYPAVSAARLQEMQVGDILRVQNEFDLRLASMDLVENWSPQEQDLVDGWRVPVVGK